MLRSVIITLILLSLAPQASAQASSVRPPTMPWFDRSATTEGSIVDLQVVPSKRLGIAFPQQYVYGLMPAVGIGSARVDAKWSLMEPTEDVYETGLDSRVDSLLAWGIDPVISFVSDDNGWAITGPSGQTASQMPDTLSDWVDVVQLVVERYDGDGVDDDWYITQNGGGVTQYMLLNEWTSSGNSQGGWPGTWDEARAFIDSTYAAVKAACDTCKVIIGAPAGNWSGYMMAAEKFVDYPIFYDGLGFVSPEQIRDNRLFMENLVAVKAIFSDAPYDYLNVHQYGTEQMVADRLAYFQQEWPGKTIVSTECGGPSLDYQKIQTARDKFNFAWYLNLHAFANEMPWTMWLKIVDTGSQSPGNDELPLLTHEDRTLAERRPQWYAYKLLALCFEDAETCEEVETGVFKLTLSGGEETYMMLAGRGDSRFTLPVGFVPAQMITARKPSTGKYRIETLPGVGDEVDHTHYPTILSEKVLID